MSLFAHVHVHIQVHVQRNVHSQPRLYLGAYVRKTAHESRYRCGLKETDERNKTPGKTRRTFNHPKLRTN